MLSENKIFVTLFLLFAIQVATLSQTITVLVENGMNKERIETISIKLPHSDLLNVDLLRIFNGSGKLFASQLIDSNMDGEVDEILFQDTFKPLEIKPYTIKESEERCEFEPNVYASFIKGREDIAWESNKVAYRMYGPPLNLEVKNGIDVWSKSVESLIINKWYDEESNGQSYHVDNGEGADFFSVGKSLGCGGSAILLNDSLHQGGVYDEYKIIENGPIRAKFVLTNTYEVNGEKITENKFISIDANSYLNRIETNYSVIPNNSKFVAGLVKRTNVSVTTDFSGKIISLWGDISKNKGDEELGTAVLFSDAKNIQIVEDNMHLMIISENDNTSNPVYYAGAGWSKQKDSFNQKSWKEYLKSFQERLDNPLIVKINK
jgi:pectinesterase